MNYAAVAMISFFENEIKQAVVQVEPSSTWKDALYKALAGGLLGDNNDIDAWVKSLPDDFDAAREELGNGEMDMKITFFSV